MSIYSKARSSILVSGDIKRQIKADLKREYAYFNKELDNGCDNPAEVEERMKKINEAINSIDNGLVNPFLSLIGFTTPETFNGFVDVENVTSGFIGRSIIINEPNNNPRKKHNFKSKEISEDLKNRIIALRSNGSFDQKNYRIESKEVRKLVTTSWGITFLRFITSKIGQLFIAAICVDLIIDTIMHYEIIKIFWKLATFQ